MYKTYIHENTKILGTQIQNKIWIWNNNTAVLCEEQVPVILKKDTGGLLKLCRDRQGKDLQLDSMSMLTGAVHFTKT